jgi:ribosomal 50S subunit-recycling heat shock protein
MRVDKFLKVSRIIKRRTVAKEACDAGRVSVNERAAKAGTEVVAGDKITVRFGTSELTVRVVSISESVRKEDAADMYEILSRERFTEL